MDPDSLLRTFPESVRRPAALAAWLVAWLACLAVAAGRIEHARTEFRNRSVEPREWRADGNSGHTEIDFGGQYLMGRMLATGRGRELYRRQALWPVVWESFPADREAPQTRESFPRHLRPAADRDKPATPEVRPPPAGPADEPLVMTLGVSVASFDARHRSDDHRHR